MNVYFRNPNKTLGKMKVDGAVSHEEAISLVKETLIEDKSYQTGMPILAVLSGHAIMPKDAA